MMGDHPRIFGALRSIGSVLGAVLIVLAFSPPPAPAQTARPVTQQVKALKITVLSTMLADGNALGEWGYSALVEVDGRKFLFDTGLHPDVVLANARTLRIDLTQVEDVVISHNHGDHTGGLLTLRRELMKLNPKAMSRLHVASGIFDPRLRADGSDSNGLAPLKAQYEALGGRFVMHAKPVQLAPGLWFTGPVPRPHPERNWSGNSKLQTRTGPAEDNVPEDASLVFATAEGLAVLTGCGHAGIINISDYARAAIARAPVFAVIGGTHLFAKGDDVLAWSAAKLKANGLKYLLGGHCTGIEATYRLRDLTGLTRQTGVVSAVGSSFTLGKGIQPGEIAA
jgi:7,8-dihydropterin-6-yl-methyl-4-(beta-D-ribofuranosyl)aminobenzene 5'-phosphate synthase